MDHITDAEKLPYVEWHEKAAAWRGPKQMQCEECKRWFFPWEKRARAPIAGQCIDIDGFTWHKDGQRCEECGFGIDACTEGVGYYGEPVDD